jgi:hypothetical protein
MAPVLSQPSLALRPRERAARRTPPLRRGARHREDALCVRRPRARACGSPTTGCARASASRPCAASWATAFEGIEIDSGPGNPHGIPGIAHSVVTNDLVDEAGHPTRVALDRVLSFFRQQLLGETARAGERARVA